MSFRLLHWYLLEWYNLTLLLNPSRQTADPNVFALFCCYERNQPSPATAAHRLSFFSYYSSRPVSKYLPTYSSRYLLLTTAVPS